MRILVVDDNATTRILASAMLRKLGYKSVATAATWSRHHIACCGRMCR